MIEKWTYNVVHRRLPSAAAAQDVRLHRRSGTVKQSQKATKM